MAKRKRETTTLQSGAPNSKTRKIAVAKPGPVYLQIIAGSYEKVLHGIVASVPREILYTEGTKSVEKPAGKENIDKKSETDSKSDDATTTKDDALEITFADCFMFNAHSSAIRCLTLSPLPSPTDSAQKLLLASGGNDERVNLYSLSATPPDDLVTKSPNKAHLPSLSGVQVSQNALNKELGALDHHNGPITRISFPTRSKLLTAAEDNTISISRTRDWTVLSTIKAPIPKLMGRPSGDTFAPGEVPAGVNDFAVHPSMKLMLSVGKGEKCMRLWNLVTGKKAGVLNFEREVLQQVGEGKYGTGEGRRIVWDKEGEEFVVAFERGAVVYDIDCKVKRVLVPKPATKVHQISYVDAVEGNVLAMSTEDGRVLFFETDGSPEANDAEIGSGKQKTSAPEATAIAQLGGRALGVSSRIKDFTILSAVSSVPAAEESTAPSTSRNLVVVTASSDGTVRLWSLSTGELDIAHEAATAKSVEDQATKIPQVGHLLAQYGTGNRITCLTAFIMNERQVGGLAEGEESEFGGFSEGPGDDDDSEDSDSDDE